MHMAVWIRLKVATFMALTKLKNILFGSQNLMLNYNLILPLTITLYM